MTDGTPLTRSPGFLANLRGFLLVAGPGFVVMLADTEAGSVITAAQSGASWGYRLLALQFLIVPLLYLVQELTIRLGLSTGKGFGELILRRFGKVAAAISIATLVLSCFGALLTELGGLAGVGELLGIPAWQTVALAVGGILVMVWTGSYHSVERIVIGLGLFELAFLVIAWRASPDIHEIGRGLVAMPLNDAGYLYLLAANLGTSVMPWTVFYQQSATIDKGLQLADIKSARLETFLGAVFCQIVTAAILVAAAATVDGHGTSATFGSIRDIADAFTAALGTSAGHLIFALGLGGGTLVATVVVCLTSAWAIGEVTGFRHSLEHHPTEAPWFYVSLAGFLVIGGLIIASGVDPVRLSIGVGVINALLLPVILGFLFLLAFRDLSGPLRIRGAYAALVGAIFLLVSGLGLYSGLIGAFG